MEREKGERNVGEGGEGGRREMELDGKSMPKSFLHSLPLKYISVEN